jgi:ABC-type multidrug transport system ATPase subunit
MKDNDTVSPCVSLASVYKRFGAVDVLRGVDLQSHAGSITGLVGLNGSGKTTLLRCILGLLHPEDGTLSVAGFIPQRHEPAMYRVVSAALENPGLIRNCTFRENVDLWARARGVSPAQMEEYIERYWQDIGDGLWTTRARTLSTGQQTLCAVCRAFVGRPQVCVLDEPFRALDLQEYDRVMQLLRDMARAGASIIVSSHRIDAIETLCDRVYMLRNGRVSSVQAHQEAHSRRWMLMVTDEHPAIDELLRHCDVQALHRQNNTWYFSVTRPQQRIPRLIRHLASQGIGVLQVRPVDSELQSRLRTHTWISTQEG